MTESVLNVAVAARDGIAGTLTPGFSLDNVVRQNLFPILPSDAHETVTGRLNVAVTKKTNFESVIVNKFKSRDDLLQVLSSSAFIPFISGWTYPKFKGVTLMDGAISCPLPKIDGVNNLTISPFANFGDISPTENNLFSCQVSQEVMEVNATNIERMLVRSIFPKNIEGMKELCKEGFTNAVQFLQGNFLLHCDRCASQLPQMKPEDSWTSYSTTFDRYKTCQECDKLKNSVVFELPVEVSDVFDRTSDNGNFDMKKLLNPFVGAPVFAKVLTSFVGCQAYNTLNSYICGESVDFEGSYKCDQIYGASN